MFSQFVQFAFTPEVYILGSVCKCSQFVRIAWYYVLIEKENCLDSLLKGLAILVRKTDNNALDNV